MVSRRPAVPTAADVALTGGFWGRWDLVHRARALPYQLEQLERTGAVHNFELVAGVSDGFRDGMFFADSDVYKWMDAVGRARATGVDDEVAARADRLTGLVGAAQAPDGYVNTWMQLHFPDGRWTDLELEHEHYCLGHLVEAGVAEAESTGPGALTAAARLAADLLVREFAEAAPHQVDGHQEVELALVRLYRATGERAYLDLARAFVDRRGTTGGVRFRMCRSLALLARRETLVRLARRRYARSHPGWAPAPSAPVTPVAPTVGLLGKWLRELLSGRYSQTDVPALAQTEPRGHAVRWLYQQVAVTMLAAETGDAGYLRTVERAWRNWVDGHLLVNGGSGAFAMQEGFGDRYDLDPRHVYSETCASVAGVLWNRELGLLTGGARYDDLAEWQLLNGTGVGMGVDGRSYFYANPLEVGPGVGREPWFQVPCCPSNLTRTWASLPTLQFSSEDRALRLHQFFSSSAVVDGTAVQVDSDLPWSGRVTVRLEGDGVDQLFVRVPSWTDEVRVTVGGRTVDREFRPAPPGAPTASGLDPDRAVWASVPVPAGGGEVVLDLGLPVRALRQDDRVPHSGGAVALARGPLLYCLEGVDHQGRPPAGSELDLATVVVDEADLFGDPLVGPVTVLRARSSAGDDLMFVPYFLWANRGPTGMTPFVALAQESASHSAL